MKGRNDLKTTHPNIAEEWSEQNFPLQPDEVNAKSRKNVWWHCKKCGNEWKSVINARVKGTVCPVCSERAVRAGYNDLATTNSELLVEWDYELNKLKPTEVSRSSAKRAWWKCRYGHSWSMKIVERAVLGKGCRECEQEYRSLFPAFAISYYAKMKGLKIELGSDRLLGIPIDVYIPSEQVTIEVNLGSEKIETLKEHLCKQRDVKLIRLPIKENETESEYRPLQKYAPGYLGYYMNSASFHNQLLPLMQGIKVTSISKTALQNTDILYPKSATEQDAIGTYFRNLDNLITLHQRKPL